MKTLMKDLQADDWQVQFTGINNLRRIVKFHQPLLKKSNCTPLFTEVSKLIENLRSGLSKNAMITFNEISVVYRRDLDVLLDSSMRTLIRKCIDSNSFISDEVLRLMVTLSTNCSESKVVSILASTFQNKSP
jgi:hypothetical protein